MSSIRPELRNGIYYAVGTFNGKRIRKSLGTRDEKIAKEQCALYEARLWKRHSYGEEAVRTFEEAALSYLQQGGESRFVAPIIKYFRGRTLGKITPGEVRQMAIELYPTASPATRNRQAIIPARAIINHGHSLGWCPRITVKLFDVPKSTKHKPVSDEWMEIFLAQCAKDGLPHLAAMILFMNQTAARVSEAMNLLGEHVDLTEGVCVLAKTKTDEWVPRYLTSELVARMATLDIQEGKRVFGYSEKGAVNRRIAAVCRRAGIEPRTTHSVGRHSFGTNVIRSGVDVKTAMDAGGWKSASLFIRTYVHSENAGREVAAVFEKKRRLATISAQPANRKRQVVDK